MELSLAIAVMTLLVAGVFSLAGGSLELLADARDLQGRQERKERFLELCRTEFANLPAGTEMDFRYVPQGKHYDTYLALRGGAGTFGFGRGDADIRRVVLAAEVASSGFIRVGVYYLDEEEDARYERNERKAPEGKFVTLLPRVREFRWRFHDPWRERWANVIPAEWEIPSLLELNLRVEGDAQASRAVFWLPAAGATAPSSQSPSEGTGESSEDRGDGGSGPSGNSPPLVPSENGRSIPAAPAGG